ncbi:hypothetical protein BEWA_025310 [Theileria equi strain WA]|uniref:Actin n=1 Tax=Theileria equi strain WA TaxID=1537102 RepID=L0AVP8_THEEQ|nr:hypothetical protein BEWA_025310 [Theileria equi strain WA]AFZ79682.1 hypothetical protein BEWA_025310 [Theileria equi strain WA]|eukprot:XP_004829348.1 hypothetical protein BEWA_025310 [Theileria equi strain WA]
MATSLPSGGDDVSAIIVDPGYDTIRIGNCQEDFPREYIPSALVKDASEWRSLSHIKRQKFSEMRRLFHLNRDGNLEVDPFVFEKLIRVGIEGTRHYGSIETCVDSKTRSEALDTTGIDGCIGTLMLNPSAHPVLVSEPTAVSKQFRDAVLEVLFEQIDVPAAYLAKRAALTAFSVGRASALIVDVGAGGTTISPVHDGIALQSTIQDSLVGGNALDLQLANMLHEDGYAPFEPSTDVCQEYYRVQLARELREKFCEVQNTSKESADGTVKQEDAYKDSVDTSSTYTDTYNLPDGTVVSMKKYKHSIPELLFTPEPARVAEFNQFKGLIPMITDCIFESDVDIRRELLSSIVVVGGLSITPGFINRITSGLMGHSLLSAAKFKIVHSSSYVEKRYSTWLGGSILASLGRFQQLWISKAEYQEHGTIIAYRRCN